MFIGFLNIGDKFVMEIKYLMKHKIVLVILLAIIVNILIFYKTLLDSETEFIEDTGFNQNEYTQIYNGYTNIIVSLRDDQPENIKSALKQYFEANVTDDNRQVHIYTYKNALNYIDYISNYGELIDAVIKQTNVKLHSGLYNNGFGYYNLLKGKYDINKLTEIKLKPVNSRAAEKVYNYQIGGMISAVVMLVMVCVFKYNQKGFETIVRTTKKGRIMLSLKRCVVAIAVAVITNILMFLPILCIAYIRYGGIECIDCLIQSCEKFAYVPYIITYGDLFLLMLIFNIISSIACAFVFWLFIKLFSERTISILGIILFLLVEYLLYNISYNNLIASFFKNVNIINYIYMCNAFINYDNWGISQNLITTFSLSLTGAIVTICITAAIVIYLSATLWDGIKIKSEFIERVKRSIKYKLAYMPVIIKEFKKIICFQKVGIIVCALLVVVTTYKFGLAGLISEDEIQLKDYYDYVQGDAYEKTDEYLTDLQEWITNARQLLQMYKESDDILSVSEISKAIDDKMKLYNSVTDKAEKVRALNGSGIENVKIVDSESLSRRYGARSSIYTCNISFMILTFIVLAYSRTFIMEKQNKTENIIRATKNGGLSFIRKKCLLEIFISEAVVSLLFFIQLYRVNMAFPMKNYELNAAIQSIEVFQDSEIKVTFLQLEIMCFTIRIIITAILTIIIALLSLLVEESVIYVCAIVSVIPYILECIGVKMFKNISLVEYFSVYTRLADSHMLIHYLLFFIIISLLMVCVVMRGVRKWKMS